MKALCCAIIILFGSAVLADQPTLLTSPATDGQKELRAANAQLNADVQLRNAAAKGDPKAQYDYAMRIANGDVLPVWDVGQMSADQVEKMVLEQASKPRFLTEDEALEWLEKSAKQNYPPALFTIAEVNFASEGNPEAIAKAQTYLRKAASLGHAPSLANVGVFTFTGSYGFPLDPPEGLRISLKAAELGNAQAQELVTNIYAGGLRGIPKDERKAVRWAQKAAAQGVTSSQLILGVAYVDGQGGLAANTSKGLALVQKAADGDNPNAARVLVKACLMFKGKNVPDYCKPVALAKYFWIAIHENDLDSEEGREAKRMDLESFALFSKNLEPLVAKKNRVPVYASENDVTPFAYIEVSEPINIADVKGDSIRIFSAPRSLLGIIKRKDVL